MYICFHQLLNYYLKMMKNHLNLSCHLSLSYLKMNHLKKSLSCRLNLSYLMKSWGPELMSNIDVYRHSHQSKSKFHNNSRFRRYKEYNILYMQSM